LQEAEGGERQLTILASGSELHLSVEARSVLQDEGIRTAVVSMPCRLLFEKQDAAKKLGNRIEEMVEHDAARLTGGEIL
ncbi:transketolase C-terminal domain-containing protein, partial [Rhizobium ruizarguesonis]